MIDSTYTRPISLYRYRSINEYTLQQLENDEIWGTRPDLFNDPYDCQLCYSQNLLRKKALLNFENFNIEDWRNIFPNLNINDSTNNYINSFQNEFKNNRQNWIIACFTEKRNSTIMWGHYANKAQGFVLEYNANKLDIASKKYKIKLYNGDDIYNKNLLALDDGLIKVCYKNEKPDVTQNILYLIDTQLSELKNHAKDYDENTISKIEDKLLPKEKIKNDKLSELIKYKDKDWSYEKEWRLWSTNQSSSEYSIIATNVKPTSIYLGEMISEENEKILLTIAKNKKIKIYKMQTKLYSNYYQLQAIEIK